MLANAESGVKEKVLYNLNKIEFVSCYKSFINKEGVCCSSKQINFVIVIAHCC